VEVHEVDFSHADILREPQVGIFGEQLVECLARLRWEGAASLPGSTPSAVSKGSLRNSAQPRSHSVGS
jgi:hypothetical protein